MARRRSNNPWRLANLALLASAASAQRIISLSSFELLSSIFITPACLDAYNTPLQGCELNDFLLGRQCSQICIQNLRRIETTIQDVCSNANPRPGTLLSRTKNGDLVAALCGAAAEDDNEDDGGQQMTTIITTTRLNSDLPMRTTTVTKAITPKPAPTVTTTVSRDPPPATTEESSTEVEDETSANPIDPPRSSESFSSEELEPTEPPTILPPIRTTSTTSQQAGNTAAPENENNDGDDNSLPGSGGGGLENVGFEASAMTCSPPGIAAFAAVAVAVIMATL